MKRFVLLASLAACAERDLPHEVSDDPRMFALANTHTAILHQFDATAPDNVEILGEPIPEPADENGNSLLVLPPASAIAIGKKHACVLTPIGEVYCWGDHSDGALGEHRVCGTNDSGEDTC